MRSWLLAPILAAVLAAGPVAAQPLPTVDLPPELERVLRDYETAWAANDADGLARLFTPDGLALPSGQAPARGTDSIRKAYSGGGGQPTTLRPVEYRISGDMAYVVGGYGPAGKGVDQGKFILVLRNIDGRWKIVADIENMNMRMGPPQRPVGKPNP